MTGRVGCPVTSLALGVGTAFLGGFGVLLCGLPPEIGDNPGHVHMLGYVTLIGGVVLASRMFGPFALGGSFLCAISGYAGVLVGYWLYALIEAGRFATEAPFFWLVVFFGSPFGVGVATLAAFAYGWPARRPRR